MNVSVLLCTRNRRSALVQTLAALDAIDVPPDRVVELVIVDNGSTDGTTAWLANYRWSKGEVRVLHESRRGKGHAYNCGLAAVRGDVLLLTDDDVRPPAAWIRTMCEPIWSGRADMVAGGVRFAPHLARPWMTPKLRAWLSSTELLDANDPGWVVAANLAFARRVLERVPGFDPELGPGALGFEDEVLFAWQVREAGFRIIGAFDPPLEHWFEVQRLERRSLVPYMRRHGASKAYVEYHWQHHATGRPRLAWGRAVARWGWHRARHPLEWMRREGISEAEAEVQIALGRAAQLVVESRRPRLYAKRGLVKGRDQ